MKCFVDLEGTIEAKPGDRVALIKGGILGDEGLFLQPDPALRPIAVLRDNGEPGVSICGGAVITDFKP